MAPAIQSLADRYPAALVTGASSGIGEAVAHALINQGITVYGTTRDPERPGLSDKVRWLRFDGSSSEGVDGFIKDQRELLSFLNLLVNNAGSSCFGEVSQLTGREIKSQLSLLVEAPVQLTRAVLPGIRESGGAIVNTSSLAAHFPMPHMSVYTAGKAALSAFTQSLLLTERTPGVCILDFQPGDFRTPFNRNQAAKRPLEGSEPAAWEHIERHLQAAPAPELAALDLIRALAKGRSGIVRTGGFFQKSVAPFAARFLPRRMLLKAIARYYQLPG